MRKVLKSSLYVEKLWKNGRGTTREIIVWPEDSGDQFLWRISLADLKDTGAFSLYPEMKRILVVLEGKEIELSHTGNHLTLPLLTPYSFDGSLAVNAKVKAPGRDFNLMLRKNMARGKVTVHSGKNTLMVTTQFLGIFSTGNFLVDEESIEGNDFFFLANEKEQTITVDGLGKYLIVEIDL